MKRKITELRSNEGIHCSTEMEFELIGELFENEGFRLNCTSFSIFKDQTVLARNGNVYQLSHCIQDERSIYSAADYLESPMECEKKQDVALLNEGEIGILESLSSYFLKKTYVSLSEEGEQKLLSIIEKLKTKIV